MSGTAHLLKAGGPFFVAKYDDGKKMNVYKSMGLKEAIEYANGNLSNAKVAQVTSEQEPHVQKDPNGEQR